MNSAAAARVASRIGRTECGSRGELHDKATRPCSRPQCSFVDAEFARQHIEGKQLRLARSVGNDVLGCGEDRRRNSSTSAIPRTQRFERYLQEQRKLLLLEPDRSTEFAQCIHVGNTMHQVPRFPKRPPACMAGDRSIQVSYREYRTNCERAAMLEKSNARNVAHSRKTGHFFRFVFAEEFLRDRNSRNL